MAPSSNSIFLQCLLLESQSHVLKTRDFSNSPSLGLMSLVYRKRVGYPWHSTQMGSSHSKWVSWSLNTDRRNRILAWRIWLQDETTTKLDQPKSWEQHPFLPIDNCLHKGCWHSSGADQMSQACSLISIILSVPENLHICVCVYTYDKDCKSGIQGTTSKHLVLILPSHQIFLPGISSKKHFRCCPGGHLQEGTYLWSHGPSWNQ